MSDYIPKEWMEEFFSRLPVKSLLRFRCLSKSWNSSISSTEFIWMHTQKTILSKPSTGETVRYFSEAANQEIYLFLLSNESTGTETILRLRSPLKGILQYYYRVVGICNGILCLLDDLFGYLDLLIIWNPAINRCITLPMPPFCFDSLGNYMFVLGFGFAIKSRDYKVVRMTYTRGDGSYLFRPKVEVNALSSGIWKQFDGYVPEIRVIEYFWTQAVVCGKVHWTAYKRSGERCVENLIMVFDLNDEIFQVLSLPDLLVNKRPTNLNAAEYGEYLAVYQYDTRMFSSNCAIWVMKQYGVTESWSKEYNVVLHHRDLGMVVGFSHDDPILLTDASGELVSYNPETQEKLSLGIYGTAFSFYYGTYKESLFLLDKGEVLPPLDIPCEESDEVKLLEGMDSGGIVPISTSQLSRSEIKFRLLFCPT